MVEQLMEKIAKSINRRGFLGKAASASAAVVMAILGFPKRADATLYEYACCMLCSKTMCQNLTQCAGTWCWTCMYYDTIDGHCYCFVYKCYECYNSSVSSSCFAVCAPEPPVNCGCPSTGIICSLGQIGGLCSE
jgi:hypothetical protein